MPVYEFEGRRPSVHPRAFVAPSAVIIGDVTIGESCYVGHGTILRGDYGKIVIGAGTAVEEGVIVHARPDDKALIGQRVTLGHGAMIHNAVIEDEAVIGMRATISDYSTVGRGAIVGEASLVKNGQRIRPGKIAVGVPAREAGPVREDRRELWQFGKQLYIDLCDRCRDGLVEIPLSTVTADPPA